MQGTPMTILSDADAAEIFATAAELADVARVAIGMGSGYASGMLVGRTLGAHRIR
jgi:hypothetical protein